MEIRTFRETIIRNVLLSLSLTFISYFYAIFELSNYSKLRDFLLMGRPFALDYLADSPLLKYLPLLPVFMLWFFVGAIVYYFYYSLANLYSFAYNYLLMLSCKKAVGLDDFTFRPRAIERLAVHFLAIIGFIALILLLVLILLPISEQIFHIVSNAEAGLELNGLLVNWSPLLILFLYWNALVAVIQLAWHGINSLENYETFKQEHIGTED